MMQHAEGRPWDRQSPKALSIDCLPSRAARLHKDKTNTEIPVEFEFQIN